MKTYAVVGAGIGGSAAAAMLTHRGQSTVLCEKASYLGGCSATFEHAGRFYNAGATTFAGYQDGHAVKRFFDAHAIVPPPMKATDPAMVVVQNGVTVPRLRDVSAFVEALQTLHPHPEQHRFWELVDAINRGFNGLDGYYYADSGAGDKCRSLFSFTPLLRRFFPYLFQRASGFIHRFFGNVTPDFYTFLEAQVRIVAQARLDEINFFTAALALGYTFNASHYIHGGMGRLFDALTAGVEDVRTSCNVQKIRRLPDRYVLQTGDGEIEARNVVLNTTVYQSAALFDNPRIRQRYARFARLDNHQSAFMLYMTIRSDRAFEHHYQIIRPHPFVHTLSNALFVSVSDAQDTQIAPPGHRSITASIHTDVRWWDKEDKGAYKRQKAQLQKALTDCICDTLQIPPGAIATDFGGTPHTFLHYVGRTQLGGNAVTFRNILPRLPGNDAPIPGLYHVGDSTFAAQGWPGVIMGVINLEQRCFGS